MRESIGSVFLYNIIILFIIITFAFLSGTLAYVKAFKANSRIVNAIEKYEGYNILASNEIVGVLQTIGYSTETPNCRIRDEIVPMEQLDDKKYYFCIYRYSPDITGSDSKDYYGVVTYMYFDFPVVGNVKIPLYAKTEKVYRFNTEAAKN